MGENRKTNGILIISLIVLVMIIVTMAYFLIKTKNEKSNIMQHGEYVNSNINEKENSNNISENTNISTNNNETNNNTNTVINTSTNKQTAKGMTYSDLMNLLYIKDKTEGDGNNVFYTYVFDSKDNYDEFEESEIKNISVLGKEITLLNKDGENTEKSVKGIDEEVVSVKIESTEGEVRGIAFLTRNGNVYYLKKDSILNNDFNAKKIPNLSQVLKIEEVSATANGEPGASECLIAITYEGSYVSIGP